MGLWLITASADAIGTLLWFLFYHPPNFAHLHRRRSIVQELKEIDFGGIFLFVAGLLLFTMVSSK